MTDQSAFQYEAQKLQRVLEHIDVQLRAIGPRYTGNDFTEQMLDLQREQRQARLEISLKEPYFGRLDFQELSAPNIKPLYIGKAGVANENTKDLLVIDWRAPVASLFYSFSGTSDAVYYDSPEGAVEGHIYLKRNILVRDSQLERVVDSYVSGQEEETVTDEFLLYRLGENKDNRLRDIVSTIQQEQDRIIRADKNKAVIIQGVAGSGKTTVALHRLAFLLYQYAGKIRAERMVVFAPNQLFLDYISGVLPELGVGDIIQTTFSKWAIEQLDNTVCIEDESSPLVYWFEEPRTKEEVLQAPGRLKGSLQFKKLVDYKLELLENELLPNASFEAMEDMILPIETIRQWFETDISGDPLLRRRERLISRIKRWLESEWKLRGISDKKIKTKANARLRAYVKKIPSLNAVQIYTSLMDEQTVKDYLPEEQRHVIKKRLKQGKAAPDDLAPLVYIKLSIAGLNQPAYDHIVIDEAQDYSPFQLASLMLAQHKPSMTILGDLQQGIHGYAGIHSWKELEVLFEENASGFYELNQSYRSTMEIIEFANHILKGMGDGVKEAVPVFRSGDEVEVISFSTSEERISHLVKTVQEWQAQSIYRTIAVLGRTERSCQLIYERLQEAGLEAYFIQSKQEAYSGGITVAPVYLSKGLEFDAVLIDEVDHTQYSLHDAKLLYVGCTRALHRLKLLYHGVKTKLLE